MAIKHRLDYLQYYISSHNFSHFFIFFEIVIKFTSHCGLHNHNKLFTFDEGVILFHDVLVLQGLQRLRLLVYLLNHMSGAQLVSDVCEFDGNFRFVFAMLTQHYLSEASHSQSSSEFIVIQDGTVVELLTY